MLLKIAGNTSLLVCRIVITLNLISLAASVGSLVTSVLALCLHDVIVRLTLIQGSFEGKFPGETASIVK